jgi:histidyl-tRNA synthetase
MAEFQSLPGFRDFYPEDFGPRQHIFRVWRQAARAFGFAEYDGPVLEPLDLYRAKSGDEIEGQLFSFTDKGGREVALRPEMTPTVCRLVGARAGTLKRPIKWFSVGEFYRYERMQKGRGRCFTQFNADLFGEPGPEAEVELIALLVQCFRAFGLTAEDFHVRLSDRNLWFYYLEALGLDEPRIQAMLGAIDKFEKMGEDAFQPYQGEFGPLDADLKRLILDFLQIKSLPALRGQIDILMTRLGRLVADQKLRNAEVIAGIHAKLRNRLMDWERLLGDLTAMGLASFVSVDLGVVRGLAYYTGFVFEAFDRKGELRALAGGGRYDDLVGKLGGAELPAAGFAIGDMTFGLLLEQRGLAPSIVSAADIYCVIGGEAERAVALADINGLRAAGYRVEYGLKPIGFGKQFKAAADSGARLALIYGSDELAKGVVKFRDLGERSEHEVARAEVASAVRDFFSGNAPA